MRGMGRRMSPLPPAALGLDSAGRLGAEEGGVEAGALRGLECISLLLPLTYSPHFPFRVSSVSFPNSPPYHFLVHFLFPSPTHSFSLLYSPSFPSSSSSFCLPAPPSSPPLPSLSPAPTPRPEVLNVSVRGGWRGGLEHR